MTVMTVRELNAPYQYVVDEQAVSDVVRLLVTGTQEEHVVSDWYRRVRPGHRRSLLEFEGLGAEIWLGVDAEQYVDELRAGAGERRIVPPELREAAARRQRMVDLVRWLRSNPLSHGVPRLSREELHERR